MGLFDRDYMRGGGRAAADPNDRSILWILIIANALMFVFAPPPIRPGAPFDPLFLKLSLYCTRDLFAPYQLITSGFLHGGVGHVFFNMWGLYLFGSLVLPHLGKWNFLWLYLISELAGNLLFLAIFWGSEAMLIGASGAVYGVMMAAAMLEPNRRFVMLFLPFTPLKTSTLVICYTVLEIIFQLTGSIGGIAHLVHLGGLVGGYLFIKLICGRQLAWDPFRWRRGSRRGGFGGAPKPEPESFRRYSGADYRRGGESGGSGGDDRPVSGAELDMLLDKISREGINSLSEYELARLRRAREEMRGGNPRQS